MNQVAVLPSSNNFESSSSFMDSGSYWQVCFNINHVTLRWRHLSQYIYFLKVQNWSYEARFGRNGDQTRQILYSTNHYFPRPPNLQSAAKACNNNFISKACYTRYTAHHSPGSSRLCWNAPTDRLVSLA